MNNCKRFCLLLLVLLLLPVSSLAGVTGYSVRNTFGEAPQTIEIILETTEDIRAVKLVDEDGSSIAASITQSQASTGKIWSLSTTVQAACSEEWTVYLRTSSGSWEASDVCFFVDITGSAAAAPAPTATPRPTIRATATPAPRWSVGSFAYVWADTKDKSDTRTNSHSGPDNSFMDSGSYRNWKITSLYALFREKYTGVSWTYAEMTYQNGYKRRVYFKNGQINHGDVPFITLSGTPARMTATLMPTYGPAGDYDYFEDERYQKVTLETGHSVSILHEENDYYFIQFVYSGKECRAWVPTSAVAVQ